MRMLYQFSLTFLALGLLGPFSFAHAQSVGETASPTPTPTPETEQTSTDAIAAKQTEIAELNKKIEELSRQKDTTTHEASLIAAQVQRIKQQLEKAQLEITQTRRSIQDVAQQRTSTEQTVESLKNDLKDKREQLRSLIRLLYQREQVSLVAILLDQQSLSQALTERAAVEEIQDRSIATVKDLQAKETELRARQAELEQQQQDLQEFQQLLAAQEADLDARHDEQATFLSTKRSEQAKYEQRLKEAQDARQEIEQGLFQLKSSGVKLSLTEATDIARYASQLTGVRAAVLLAVLKVESNVGSNIGNGQFPDDMQPASREAFLRITAKLGLDPRTAPISARPRNYSGWGGAVGPAQIMPQTWETIEGRLSQLLKKPLPNPYELTDAFVATAIFLADRGATRPEGEQEAVGRYLAGPNWQRFTWYNDRVFAVAREYEKEGL